MLNNYQLSPNIKYSKSRQALINDRHKNPKRGHIKDRNKNPKRDPNDKLGSETSVRTKPKKTGNQVSISLIARHPVIYPGLYIPGHICYLIIRKSLTIS